MIRGYVLVGGWPGAGKTTLARALAHRLGVALLSKDDVKEALGEAWGPPADVAASRRLGVAAVHATLRAARGCPAAVVDSTWFPYTAPLVARLDGPVVELRCLVPRHVARERFERRRRDGVHLDRLRADDELWAEPVPPLGVGPLVEVDTAGPVDVDDLAARIVALMPG